MVYKTSFRCCEVTKISQTLKMCSTFPLHFTTVFSILTIILSLFNENQKIFYQNNHRKNLCSLQYERKFSEYPYYLFMRKNKNVRAFLTLHCIPIILEIWAVQAFSVET